MRSRMKPGAVLCVSLLLVLTVAIGSLATASCAANKEASAGSKAAEGGSMRLPRTSASPATADGDAELPRITLNPPVAQRAQRVTAVKAGGDLQAALDAASPGDTITLEAGATFTGNFRLPRKEGKKWVVITSSNQEGIAPPGTRIKPEIHSASMPKIITPNRSAALSTAEGAHHYQIIGIEIAVSDAVEANGGIVLLGDGSGAQSSLDQVPHDLVLDRCYIHGNPTGNIRRGVALNSADTAIIYSHISDIHEAGADTQAIAGWNGPGPFKIEGNYLEAAGENLMFGGADPKIPNLVPSDIEIKRNHFFKPLSWRGGSPSSEKPRWTVKNLFELKNAQRVMVEGNVFENCWVSAQAGKAILFKSVNQGGNAPWSVTADVTFKNNIVRHAAIGVDILGKDPSQPVEHTRRIQIKNNLFEDINAERWGGGSLGGYFLTLSNASNIKVSNNTVINSGGPVYVYVTPAGSKVDGFTFTGNIVNNGPKGVKGDGTHAGSATLEAYFTDYKFRNNVLAGGRKEDYPEKNFFPASLTDIGFVDLSGGNYALSQPGPYVDSGAGCDMDILLRATSGVAARSSAAATKRNARR